MQTVISIVNLLFTIYTFLIFVRVLLSWFRVDPYNPIIQVLYRLTDPVLKPLQRIIPPIGGAIDISPVVALIGLEILHRLVIYVLTSL